MLPAGFSESTASVGNGVFLSSGDSHELPYPSLAPRSSGGWTSKVQVTRWHFPAKSLVLACRWPPSLPARAGPAGPCRTTMFLPGSLAAQPHTWAGGTGTRSHSLPVAESGLEAGGCQHPSRHPALHPADPPPPHCVSTSKQTHKKVCEQ